MADKSPSDSQVISAIRRVSKDLGHPPSQSEFFEYTEFTEKHLLAHFADWDEASRFAGLKPHPEKLPPTPEQLLTDWANVVRKLGRIPTPNMYQREGSYKLRTIKKEVGTWPAIIEKFREFANLNSDWSDVLSYLPETHKPKTDKLEPKNTKLKNTEPKNTEPENIEPKNTEPENIEPKNIEPKNIEPKNAEPKNAEPKNAEPKNAEPKNTELNNTVSKNTKPESEDTSPAPNKEPEPMPQSPNPSSNVHSKLDDRPVFGDPVAFRGLRYAPVNESGVVFIFGMVAQELGYSVEVIQAGFPNCEARRKIGTGKWQRVRIEFEYESSDFANKGHATDGCDLIVCWNHNWTNCPAQLEVVELASLIEKLED